MAKKVFSRQSNTLAFRNPTRLHTRKRVQNASIPDPRTNEKTLVDGKRPLLVVSAVAGINLHQGFTDDVPSPRTSMQLAVLFAG